MLVVLPLPLLLSPRFLLPSPRDCPLRLRFHSHFHSHASHSLPPSLHPAQKVALSVYTALFGMPVVFDMIFNPNKRLPSPVGGRRTRPCTTASACTSCRSSSTTLTCCSSSLGRRTSSCPCCTFTTTAPSAWLGYLINIPIAYGTICVRFALTPRFTQPLYDPRLTD